MSPERVRAYWYLIVPFLERLSVDADEMTELDPMDLEMFAVSLRGMAQQIETLAQNMPGIVCLEGAQARVIEDAA